MITGTISASKLDGALPAINGANLTGVGDGVLKGGNDPAIDTNPAAGVGAVWLNTSSGSMYVCTDATTDANVWINIGGGTGDVEPFHGGGTTSGYIAGGYTGGPRTDAIEKFAFSSGGASAYNGNLVQNRSHMASGNSSSVNGYTTAGVPGYVTHIDKFNFSSEANATDNGDLNIGTSGGSAQSSITDGYTVAGYSASYGWRNEIDKFTFASDGNATDIGDSLGSKDERGGCSSRTHGYSMGGQSSGTPQNVIERFSFSVNGNATDVGDMTSTRNGMTGNQTETHGYSTGGNNEQGEMIDKFSFVSNGNATDIGNLTVIRYGLCGQSSSTHGYTSGGSNAYSGGPSVVDVIDRFPFASDTNATDVGDLQASKSHASGQQF